MQQKLDAFGTPKEEGVEELYAAFADKGLAYGPSFQAIRGAVFHEGGALARLHMDRPAYAEREARSMRAPRLTRPFAGIVDRVVACCVAVQLGGELRDCDVPACGRDPDGEVRWRC